LIPENVDLQAKLNYPKQLELPTIRIDGGSVLGAIAFAIALVGSTAIVFGIAASVGKPPEYELTRILFGGTVFLANYLAVIVGLCALIIRPKSPQETGHRLWPE